MELFKGFNSRKTLEHKTYPKFSVKNLCKQEPHTAIELLAQLEHHHKQILTELVNHLMEERGFTQEQATLTVLDDVTAERKIKYGDDGGE